jgi:hypothetical protein
MTTGALAFDMKCRALRNAVFGPEQALLAHFWYPVLDTE